MKRLDWMTQEQFDELVATGATSILDLARRTKVPGPTIIHRLKAGLSVAVAADPATRLPPIAKTPRPRRVLVVEVPVDGLTRRERGARRRERRKIDAGNNLAALFPKVAAEWATDLNGGVPPAKIAPKARGDWWWRCSVCDREYEARIANRTRAKSPSGCPDCADGARRFAALNRAEVRQKLGENLAALFPVLAAELCEDDGPPAHLVSPGSGTKRRWRCREFGHEFVATPGARTSKDNGCPRCWARRKVEGARERAVMSAKAGNSLAHKFDEVAAEWHPDNAFGPESVTPRSDRKVRWLGRCGHEWLARVAGRTERGGSRGCPVCDGKAVSPDRNFAVARPQVAREWSERNEKGPDQYTVFSKRKVWWRCGRDACGNEWQAEIGSRSAGRGCPACTLAKRSKVEVWIAFELARFFSDVEPKDTVNVRVGGSMYSLDVVLSRSLRIAFEYDGHRYHGDGPREMARARALSGDGWIVIRAREKPLTAIDQYSFSIDGQRAWSRPDRVARLVISRARDAGLRLSDDAVAYLDADGPVAREEADAFIAKKMVKSGKGKRTGRPV